MSKIRDEEIIIDIDSSQSENNDFKINIIFRNPRNEDFKYTLDRKKILLVKDLRRDVINYNFILHYS
jgi:hypothetical protein